jgi:hypothetical protein
MQPEKLQSKIHFISDQRVMLDHDLAELYEVETRSLNQAVKRNIKRFPADFMFQLNREELNFLMSQNVISKKEKRGGTQKLPYAFTEQGMAMLSDILSVWPKSPFSSLCSKNNCSFTLVNSAIIFFYKPRNWTFQSKHRDFGQTLLKSEKAIKVNINIMRAFVVLRQFAHTNENLTRKLKEARHALIPGGGSASAGRPVTTNNLKMFMRPSIF